MSNDQLNKLAQDWLDIDRDPDTRAQIKALLNAKDYDELNKRLSKRIVFGTAGLRSCMEAGFSRINDVTILQASQGLAKYLIDFNARNGKKQNQLSVVIGHDHRHHSQRYADLTAAAFLHYGFKVYYLGPGVIATPVVPFAVDHYSSQAGVMITSSHNPKQDNGYKVYWGNGCQIIPPHDKGIQDSIMRNLKPIFDGDTWNTDPIFKDHTKQLVYCKSETVDAYISAIKQNLIKEQVGGFQVVYTPMHGVGYEFAQRVSEELTGEKEVEDVKEPIKVEKVKEPVKNNDVKVEKTKKGKKGKKNRKRRNKKKSAKAKAQKKEKQAEAETKDEQKDSEKKPKKEVKEPVTKESNNDTKESDKDVKEAKKNGKDDEEDKEDIKKEDNDEKEKKEEQEEVGKTNETDKNNETEKKTANDQSNVEPTNEPKDDHKPDVDETKPDETKPDETKPDEAKPDESKPDESKPDESKPDESKPDESKPDTKKMESTTQDNKLSVTQHEDDKSSDLKNNSDTIGANQDKPVNIQDAPNIKHLLIPVPEQKLPDPDFPTVSFPNPEEKGALSIGIKKAESLGIPLVIANDPDADRFDVAITTRSGWKKLTGNEIGFLFAYYLASKIPKNELDKVYMVSSTVSSHMIAAMAKKMGFHHAETLTGFKWLGNKAIELEKEGFKVPFAYEEAIGFMFSVSHDKDGISALAVFLQMYQDWKNAGKSIASILQLGYRKFGYYQCCNGYYRTSDKSLIATIFDNNIRGMSKDQYPSHIGKFSVASWTDLTLGYDSSTPNNIPALPVDPSSEMITCILKGANESEFIRFTVRGSGTEPKLKVYIEAKAEWEARSKKLAKEVWNVLKREWFRPGVNDLVEVCQQ